MEYRKAHEKLIADIRDAINGAADEIAKSNLQHLHIKIHRDTLTGILELLHHSAYSVLHQPASRNTKHEDYDKLKLGHLVENLDGKFELLNLNLEQAEDDGMLGYLCEEALEDINKLIGD